MSLTLNLMRMCNVTNTHFIHRQMFVAQGTLALSPVDIMVSQLVSEKVTDHYIGCTDITGLGLETAIII